MTFDAWRELYLADPVRFHALSRAANPARAATPDVDWLLADHWTSVDQDARDLVCTRRHAIALGWANQPCYQAHLDAARAWDSARG